MLVPRQLGISHRLARNIISKDLKEMPYKRIKCPNQVIIKRLQRCTALLQRFDDDDLVSPDEKVGLWNLQLTPKIMWHLTNSNVHYPKNVLFLNALTSLNK